MSKVVSLFFAFLCAFTTGRASACYEDLIANSLNVVDSGRPSEEKLALIKNHLTGSTEITLVRNWGGAITEVEIRQTVVTGRSGALLELNSLLSDLLTGERLSARPVINVVQEIYVVGEAKVAGLRFEGSTLPNARFRLNVENQIQQLKEGQTFIALSMENNLGAIAAYGAGIEVGGNVNLEKGATLIHQHFDNFTMPSPGKAE